MDIFNKEQLDNALERHIKVNEPFRCHFPKNILTVVVVDPKGDVCITKEDFCGRYTKVFNLSQCTEGDYALICKRIAMGTLEGIVFENVDQIPDIADKYKLENLVVDALKRDVHPIADDIIKGEINFPKLSVGIICKKIPDYAKDLSMSVYIIGAKDNGK